jgi:hypothetical protein
MSETPETDAAQIFLGFTPDEGDYFVPVKTAHKLEREREETKENLKITQDAWIQAKVERVEALCERDEARETAERYRLEANAMMMQRDRLIEVLQNIRTGWGGQKTAPECDYDDCKFLRPIDQALAAIKGEKNE